MIANLLNITGMGFMMFAHSYGSHEIVVETPCISRIWLIYRQNRSMQLSNVCFAYANTRKNPFIEYVLAYKNYGVAAGSRNIGHSRSQIMAVPVLPMRVKDKTNGAEKYFENHERCLFCDMVSQELKIRNV